MIDLWRRRTSATCSGCTNMPRTLVVWSARPSHPLIRWFVRPHGLGPGSIADRSPVAKRISGYSGVNVVTTTSPTSPGATGSPVPGMDQLENDPLVDHHAFAKLALRARALISDDADIRGAVALQHAEPAAAEFGAQRRRQGFRPDQRLLQRGNVAALARRAVEQDLEEGRRPDIADRPQIGDRAQLLLGLAGAGRDHRAAERLGAALDHRARRGQMIREGVVHEIAGAKPGGEEGPREAPVIRPPALRFVDRPGRHEDPSEGRYRRRRQAAKRRVLPLQLDQFGFAGQRQFGQAAPIDDIFRMNPGEPMAIGRRALLRCGNDLRQRRHQSRFALGRIACLECVVELRLHPKPPYAAGVISPSNLLPTEPPHQARGF